MSLICRFFFWIIGWKISGKYHREIKKKVLIVAPHTSNWDFPIGLLARGILNDKIKYVGKHTLFKPPFGWLMKWLGGIPVNRQKSTNFVRSVVDLYAQRDALTIVLAPEGTRKKVEKFKTGFYFIAQLARIPIIMIKFDYMNKTVHFADPFYPTEDPDTDLNYIQDHFRGVKGKIPENSFS